MERVAYVLSGQLKMRRAPLLELHLGVIAKWPR